MHPLIGKVKFNLSKA